jgi:hypothetical protein
VSEASREIADAGKFDQAIFEAYKLAEHAIQRRINSTHVGLTLVDEAFATHPPKIHLSDDPRESNWNPRPLRRLFRKYP